MNNAIKYASAWLIKNIKIDILLVLSLQEILKDDDNLSKYPIIINKIESIPLDFYERYIKYFPYKKWGHISIIDLYYKIKDTIYWNIVSSHFTDEHKKQLQKHFENKQKELNEYIPKLVTGWLAYNIVPYDFSLLVIISNILKDDNNDAAINYINYLFNHHVNNNNDLSIEYFHYYNIGNISIGKLYDIIKDTKYWEIVSPLLTNNHNDQLIKYLTKYD
jgi:hypothetical protein